MEVLAREKEMIRNGLNSLRELENFEGLLESFPEFYEELVSRTKDELLARRFRSEGNELFRQNNHDICTHYKILQKYNQSIATSPLNSEALAQAYGNRSAILEHIGKYEESILAIDMAVRITQSPPLQVKLLCRKAKCAAKIGSNGWRDYIRQARIWFDRCEDREEIRTPLSDLIDRTERNERNQYYNRQRNDTRESELFDLISRGETLSRDTVRTAYNEQHGRHLIAGQEFGPNEILVMEKTFNSPTYADQIYLYCWHCSAFLWDIYPCPSCMICCFCSDQCRAESWRKYHEVECEILVTLTLMYSHLDTSCPGRSGSPVINQFGMRIFITAIKQSGNARNLRDVLESCDTDACNASLLDQNFDENLPADDYRYVYALSSNVEKNDIAAFVKNTTLHLVILAKLTPTFGDIFDRENFDLENLVNNDDILFMGAVLLKYCAVCDFHALGNYRVPDCKEKLACGRPGYGPISWSLGLKTSLVRRNCVPNTRRFMIGSNKVILFTILPIEEGAQIIDAHSDMNYSHLSIFDDVPKIERQMAFQKRYGFACGCRSCEEYWPEITYEANYMHQYLQLKTSDSLSEECNKLCDLFLGFNESFCRSSAAEKMHRFALCIDQCMEVCPLPSEIPACMVRSLCAVMLTSFGYFCQPQVSEKCHR